MAKRVLKFNNKRVTELSIEFTKHPSKHLRNKILKAAMPLVAAAIFKKRVLPEQRDDMQQECAVKLLKAIPKFNPHRGSAFAFFWTTICNTIITQRKKMTSTTMSLTSDDDAETASAEVDSIGADLFQTPENQYILARIAKALEEAFTQTGFHSSSGRKHRKVLGQIKKSIQNGELFFNKNEVMRKLGRMGLKKADVKNLIDFALIRVRKHLLDARKEAGALNVNSPF